MSNTVSGKEAVKILCRRFGFDYISQKGSHVKLRKIVNNQTITVIVPMHEELAIGTWKSMLEMAKVDEKDFWEYV